MTIADWIGIGFGAVAVLYLGKSAWDANQKVRRANESAKRLAHALQSIPHAQDWDEIGRLNAEESKRFHDQLAEMMKTYDDGRPLILERHQVAVRAPKPFVYPVIWEDGRSKPMGFDGNKTPNKTGKETE